MEMAEFGLWLFGSLFLMLLTIPFGISGFYLYALFFGEDKIRR